MKYRCPKCDISLESNYSRYYVWRCEECLHKARGIHWDANMVDYYLKAVPFSPLFWKRYIFTPSDRTYDFKFEGGGPDVTACPFCGGDVYGNNGSTKDGSWPSVCSACCRSLPIHQYKEKETNIVEENGPEQKKPDYEKLRKLINRL